MIHEESETNMASIHYCCLVAGGETEMTTMTAPTKTGFLSDELIEACGERAAMYDRENSFFTEDWEAIKATGFLKFNTPKELGGYGMSPLDVSRELRRLAYRAPA